MHVCAKCLGSDYAINDFIEENANSEYCNFCSTTSEQPIAAELSEVAKFIVQGIRTEYSTANEELPWDSEDKQFVGHFREGLYELLEEIGLEIEDTKLIEKLDNALGNEFWTRGILETDSDIYIGGWNNFAQRVMHKTRYTFLLAHADKKAEYYSDEVPPHQMLDDLVHTIETLDLFDIWQPEANIPLFRARLSNNEKFMTAADLGAPPEEHAKRPNRMSPAGIPMFYGALDIETAVKETFAGSIGKPEIASVGVFGVLQPLRIMDLTKLPPLPSLFDQRRNRLREPIKFLEHFIEQVTLPVKKDDREHIDYVPTQVFTEFVRILDDPKIDGIVYPSAANQGEKSFVLFVENHEACDKNYPSIEGKKLVLTAVEHYRVSAVTAFERIGT